MARPAEYDSLSQERIREKDHGLGLLYNDSHIYFLLHPEQAALYKLLGDYDYLYLNGENIPDVRQRNLSWIATITREFPGKRVMAITHHLTILATGVTRYIGNPHLGSQGKLELCEYNRQYDKTGGTLSVENLGVFEVNPGTEDANAEPLTDLP